MFLPLSLTCGHWLICRSPHFCSLNGNPLFHRQLGCATVIFIVELIPNHFGIVYQLIFNFFSGCLKPEAVVCQISGENHNIWIVFFLMFGCPLSVSINDGSDPNSIAHKLGIFLPMIKAVLLPTNCLIILLLRYTEWYGLTMLRTDSTKIEEAMRSAKSCFLSHLIDRCENKWCEICLDNFSRKSKQPDVRLYHFFHTRLLYIINRLYWVELNCM